MNNHERRHSHHGEACACRHSEHRHDSPDCRDGREVFGEIHVESHLHDEAQVVSGQLALRGDALRVKAELQAQLSGMAKAVAAMGGIVGHIKASCETTTVDMYSVTDTEASSKQSPEASLRINLAAIVFAVGPEDVRQMVRHALEKIRDGA